MGRGHCRDPVLDHRWDLRRDWVRALLRVLVGLNQELPLLGVSALERGGKTRRASFTTAALPNSIDQFDGAPSARLKLQVLHQILETFEF